MRSFRPLACCASVFCALSGACGETTTSVGETSKTPSSAVSAPATPEPAAAAAKNDAPPASDVTPHARASNAFGYELYRRARSAPGNFAISPVSLSSAVAMTWAGARGETADQIKKTLYFAGDQKSVGEAWGKLARGLTDWSRPLHLSIANRLFGDRSYTFLQPFLDETRANFGAPLESLDFKGAQEPSRARINGWVEEQTEKKISNLLPPQAITKQTRLVLVNAIYFLAEWAEPFAKESTYDQEFSITPTKKKKVKTMHHGMTARMAQVDGAKVLELSYKGGDASMLFVLPDKVDGLADVENALGPAKIDGWRAALKSERVAVSIPKFEVNPAAPMALAAHLADMGMPIAFDKERADFTGIGNPPNSRERLHIDQVFHKAFVKVDEKGTEAAAATAVTMAAAGAAAPEKIQEFTADHPFFFAIVDKGTGLVLFMGRVAEP